MNSVPFRRLKDENSSETNKQGPTQSQYFGVIKVDTDINEFAVEFPKLIIEKCLENSFQLPSCCRDGGNHVILRAGITSEYLAGQFYTYVIRILYGNGGVKAAHQTYSSNETHGEEVIQGNTT